MRVTRIVKSRHLAHMPEEDQRTWLRTRLTATDRQGRTLAHTATDWLSDRLAVVTVVTFEQVSR